MNEKLHEVYIKLNTTNSAGWSPRVSGGESLRFTDLAGCPPAPRAYAVLNYLTALSTKPWATEQAHRKKSKRLISVRRGVRIQSNKGHRTVKSAKFDYAYTYRQRCGGKQVRLVDVERAGQSRCELEAHRRAWLVDSRSDYQESLHYEMYREIRMSPVEQNIRNKLRAQAAADLYRPVCEWVSHAMGPGEHVIPITRTLISELDSSTRTCRICKGHGGAASINGKWTACRQCGGRGHKDLTNKSRYIIANVSWRKWSNWRDQYDRLLLEVRSDLAQKLNAHIQRALTA